MPAYIRQGGRKRRLELIQTRNLTTIAERPPSNQVYPTLVQFSTARRQWVSFQFPFPPVNIQYQNLTPEWVEVDRPGYVPLIGLRKYNLMRLQFEFLVAAPWDGISFSVDEELKLLREMANGTEPVYFRQMDAFTSMALALPGSQRNRGAGLFFRITDFSVQSMRRNPANEITAAQCSIALQEDYNLDIKAVTMPEISYPAILRPRIKTSSTSSDNRPERCLVYDQVLGVCAKPDYTGLSPSRIASET